MCEIPIFDNISGCHNLILTTVIGVIVYLILVLIFIFVIINDVKHFACA